MRSFLAITIAVMLLSSCATPVLRKDLLDQGRRPGTLEEIKSNPYQYTGRLFALGGIIVSTRLTKTGSMIEALYVPVDENGYLRESSQAEGRFFAFYPSDLGVLDPAIYAAGRRVSLVADFVELQKGAIGEMEYFYPLFRIRQLYLWEQRRNEEPRTFFHFGIFTGF